MATITTNPRRRLSKVPAARSYAGVASKYAASFQTAIDQQEQNDISTKLNLFRLGSMTYADFKSFLEQKIKDANGNSKKMSDYSGILVDAEKYNTQLIESNAKNTAEKLRTKLLEKIPGQVTNADELRIVRELKKAVDPNSGVYADLVTEEAKIKNSLASAGAAGGKKGMQDNLDKYYAHVSTENANLIKDYKAGKITGYELDQKLYQNGVNFQDAISQAEKAGANIPTTYYAAAEDTNYIKQELAQREVGQVFDVMNKSGVVEPVTHQELEADKLKTSPDYVRSKFVIQPDATGYLFNIVDTSTGKQVNQVPATTQSEAVAMRKQLEDQVGFSVVVPKSNANGIATLQQYNYDPKTQSYSTAENPGQKIYSPVSTGFENRFTTQPNTNLGDFLNAGITKLKNFMSPDQTTIDYEKLNKELYPVATQAGPFMSPTILNAPVGTGATTTTPTTPEKPMIAPTAGPNFFDKAVSSVKDFFGSARPTPASITPPGNMPVPQGNLDISGMNFNNTPFKLNLPDFKVPDINMPGFNLNLGGFNAPFGQPSATGPSMGPTSNGPGFVDKLKSFGQSALGSVKKFFGF